MKKLILALLVVICCFSVSACGEKKGESEICTITFVQEGENDVVKTVEKGKALTDIPLPKSFAGYVVTWDKTDFSKIEENIVVYAIIEKGVFTVTYDLGINKTNPNATIGNVTEQVTYLEDFVPQIPYAYNYEFVGWYIEGTNTQISAGEFKLTDDVTLVAKWIKFTPNV